MKLKLTINHQEHIKKINKITLKNQRIRRSYFRVNVAQASSYRLPPWRRRKTASDELRPPVLATARRLLLLLYCWTIEEEEGDEGTTAGDDDQVRREELVNRKLKQDRLCWVYRREELMKKGAAATTPRTDSCNPWWWRPNQRLQTELKQMVICTYSSKHPRDSKHTVKLKLTVGKEGSSWRWMRQLKEQTEKMKQMQLKQSATMA